MTYGEFKKEIKTRDIDIFSLCSSCEIDIEIFDRMENYDEISETIINKFEDFKLISTNRDLHYAFLDTCANQGLSISENMVQIDLNKRKQQFCFVTDINLFKYIHFYQEIL